MHRGLPTFRADWSLASSAVLSLVSGGSANDREMDSSRRDTGRQEKATDGAKANN